MAYQKKNHKYIERTVSSTTGKYIYKYAPTRDRNRFRKEAKKTEDRRHIENQHYSMPSNVKIDDRLPSGISERIKNAYTVDIEASRGKNRYVMKDGHMTSHPRPKIFNSFMYQSDWVDRNKIKKKHINDIKSGKITSNGKRYVQSIVFK